MIRKFRLVTPRGIGVLRIEDEIIVTNETGPSSWNKFIGAPLIRLLIWLYAQMSTTDIAATSLEEIKV